MWPFSDFQYGFRSSRSTVELLTVVYMIELLLRIDFLLFSVIDGFEWFWMAGHHKNIQLIWEFLKAPFLHFSCYTLMTFLTMLSVTVASMLY